MKIGNGKPAPRDFKSILKGFLARHRYCCATHYYERVGAIVQLTAFFPLTRCCRQATLCFPDAGPFASGSLRSFAPFFFFDFAMH
jgi:hypothetical protein